MPRLSSSYVFGIVLITVFGYLEKINAAVTTSSVGKQARSDFELRDVAIRKALLSISIGNLPPNDDRLIEWIGQNLREVAIRENDPSLGIEVAARLAQEAVSEVTAAYTAIIFQSSSVAEAARLFNRFEKTVNKIVDFAKSGSYVSGYENHLQTSSSAAKT